jgi:hypothetical protein
MCVRDRLSAAWSLEMPLDLACVVDVLVAAPTGAPDVVASARDSGVTMTATWRATSALDASSSVKPILSRSMTTVGMRRHY